eukprot:8945673-Alexandrium_andersonii.AAC.1
MTRPLGWFEALGGPRGNSGKDAHLNNNCMLSVQSPRCLRQWWLGQVPWQRQWMPPMVGRGMQGLAARAAGGGSQRMLVDMQRRHVGEHANACAACSRGPWRFAEINVVQCARCDFGSILK